MAVLGNQLTTTLDELFKDDEVTQWYPKQSATFRRIQSAGADKINAKGGLYLVENKRPQAIAAASFTGSDGSDFPTGGKLGFLQLTVLPITHRASVEISSNVEAQNDAALKQRPAKSYDYVLRSVKSLIEAYGLKQSRELWGDGVGEIARVSAVAGGTAGAGTITCATAGNLFGTFLLQPGMQIQIHNGSSGTIRAYAEIDTINRGATTATLISLTSDAAGATNVTLAGAGVTANDRVYMRGCYNANWSGINFLTQPAGAFQGLADRSGHYRLPGLQQDMAGATLTVGVVRKMISDKEMRCDGAEASGEFFASTQIDAYEATGLPTQVYGQNDDTLKQGYNRNKMRFDSRSWTRDLYIPRDVLAFLDLDQIDKFEMQPFKPLRNSDGSYEYMAPSVTTPGTHRDAKMIYMRGIGNIGTGDPSSLGVWYYGFSTAGLSTGNV